MGKFMVVGSFSLVVCFVVYHFFPASGGSFMVKGTSIPWMAVIGLGAIWGGYRLAAH